MGAGAGQAVGGVFELASGLFKQESEKEKEKQRQKLGTKQARAKVAQDAEKEKAKKEQDALRNTLASARDALIL